MQIPTKQYDGANGHFMFGIEDLQFAYSGAHVTPSATPDQLVHIEETAFTIDGTDYKVPQQTKTLDQDDSTSTTLSSSEQYTAILSLGVSSNLGSLTLTKGSIGGGAPSTPTDEILIAEIVVNYESGGSSVISASDITQKVDLHQIGYPLSSAPKAMRITEGTPGYERPPIESDNLQHQRDTHRRGAAAVENALASELDEDGTRLFGLILGDITTTNPTGSVQKHVCEPFENRQIRRIFAEYALDKDEFATAYPANTLSTLEVTMNAEEPVILAPTFMGTREKTIPEATADGANTYSGKLLTRGDFDPSISTVDQTVTVEVDTSGAADGSTAKIKTKLSSDSSYCTAFTVTWNEWFTVQNAAGNDIGIECLLTRNEDLTATDKWTFNTIRTGGSPTYTSVKPMNFHNAKVEIDGTEYFFKSAQLTIELNVSASTGLSSPYPRRNEAGKNNYQVELERPMDIDSRQFLREAKAGNSVQVKLTASSENITGTYDHSVELDMPNVHFEPATPAPEIEEIAQTLTGYAKHTSTSTPELTATIYNTISNFPV